MPVTIKQSASTRLLAAGLFVVPLFLLGACGGQSGEDADDSEPEEQDSAPTVTADSASEPDAESAGPLTAEALTGEWVKIDDGDPACADYPDRLTFETYGYLTSVHDDRAPVLDGGSYEVDGDQLVLSNPVDAMVPFPATLNDDELALDTGTCIVRYRRSNQPGGD